MVLERYKNTADYYYGRPKLIENLKGSKVVKMKLAMRQVELATFRNNVCIQISHLKVFQQQRGSACGFHMLWNTKCLVRALLSNKKY